MATLQVNHEHHALWSTEGKAESPEALLKAVSSVHSQGGNSLIHDHAYLAVDSIMKYHDSFQARFQIASVGARADHIHEARSAGGDFASLVNSLGIQSAKEAATLMPPKDAMKTMSAEATTAFGNGFADRVRSTYSEDHERYPGSPEAKAAGPATEQYIKAFRAELQSAQSLDTRQGTQQHLPRDTNQTRGQYDQITQSLHPDDAKQFGAAVFTGPVQSYQHNETGRYIHMDTAGQFYNQQKQPITQQAALDHAIGAGKHHGEVIQHRHDNGISM